MKAPLLVSATIFTNNYKSNNNNNNNNNNNADGEEEEKNIIIFSSWNDGSLLQTPCVFLPKTNEIHMKFPSKKILLPTIGMCLTLEKQEIQKEQRRGERKTEGGEGREGERLFVGGGDGKIYCFDVFSCALLWEVKLKLRKVTEMVLHPYTSELWCASSEVIFIFLFFFYFFFLFFFFYFFFI